MFLCYVVCSVKVVKIPLEYYNKLEDLRAELWLETKKKVSLQAIMAEVFSFVDWDILREKFKES